MCFPKVRLIISCGPLERFTSPSIVAPMSCHVIVINVIMRRVIDVTIIMMNVIMMRVIDVAIIMMNVTRIIAITRNHFSNGTFPNNFNIEVKRNIVALGCRSKVVHHNIASQ